MSKQRKIYGRKRNGDEIKLESKKIDGGCSPSKKGIIYFLAAGLIGCVIFGVLFAGIGARWLLGTAITFGMCAYHMIIRLLAPVMLSAVFHRKYNARSRWFRQKSWESKLYHFLRVKKWKAKAMTYDPREFSLKIHTVEEVINNMCHAEAVHELIMVLSFTSLFFAIPFGSFEVFLITAVFAAAVDGGFVLIQRYNRPRLILLAEQKKGRGR